VYPATKHSAFADEPAASFTLWAIYNEVMFNLIFRDVGDAAIGSRVGL
jgi:hypothetical protein